MVVHTSTVTARTMINEAAVTPSIPGQILNDSSLVLLRSPLPENPSAVKNRALIMHSHEAVGCCINHTALTENTEKLVEYRQI